eukprot:04207_5
MSSKLTRIRLWIPPCLGLGLLSWILFPCWRYHFVCMIISVTLTRYLYCAPRCRLCAAQFQLWSLVVSSFSRLIRSQHVFLWTAGFHPRLFVDLICPFCCQHLLKFFCPLPLV